MKGLVIAGTQSHSGKTTISLGLMAAFSRLGLKVAPFKVGPDFIDPGHHQMATGRASTNLDGWMLPRAFNQDLFARNAAGADLALVEGVMGLFDGYEGTSEAGSTAQMAKWLELPVLLVVDARSMARSAAALVRGFETFDPAVRFAGVLFNRLGSDRHRRYLTEALKGHVAMARLGGLPRAEHLVIPERHLGLVTREDHPLGAAYLDDLATLVETCIDLDRMLAELPEIYIPTPVLDDAASSLSRVRIGVARDAAFCFYYAENLRLLERAGARLVFFSPLADTALPPDLDGLYIGGGYPELFAAQLSANTGLAMQINRLSAEGMPIYAECGGLMYLCRALEDLEGRRHAMCGAFPFTTAMATQRHALGYREIRLHEDTLIGAAGQRLRGHEFHYSGLTAGEGQGIRTVYAVTPRHGEAMLREGYQVHRTLGSYIHLHFGSHPTAAEALVEACRAYRQD